MDNWGDETPSILTKRNSNELEVLRFGAQLFLDWHSMDTEQFVEEYGHGVSMHTIGDVFRHAARLRKKR